MAAGKWRYVAGMMGGITPHGGAEDPGKIGDTILHFAVRAIAAREQRLLLCCLSILQSRRRFDTYCYATGTLYLQCSRVKKGVLSTNMLGGEKEGGQDPLASKQAGYLPR